MAQLDLSSYEEFVSALRSVTTASDPALVTSMLDGRASTELRRLVPLGKRRSLGAFFTPHALADALAEPLADEKGPVTVGDTSCGAGELLLAAQRVLSDSDSPSSEGVSLIGVDLVSQFVSTARLRLSLQSALLGRTDSVDVSCQCGLGADVAERATHLLLNPPYAMREAPSSCTWAGGTVNGAGLFFEAAVTSAHPGTRIRAVLPDVLRSGSRYRLWRSQIDRLIAVDEIQTVGRFNKWTDVDVFILSGIVSNHGADAAEMSPGWVDDNPGMTVGDLFEVSVGPVVQHRSPSAGPRHPYLTSKGFDDWTRIVKIEPTRRFKGRLVSAPFVVIKRTSRPGDSHRARGAVVADKRPVAVDNHVIIAQPKDHLVRTCRNLLEVLASKSTTIWLDNQIRCRHLTVGAIMSIPWATER